MTSHRSMCAYTHVRSKTISPIYSWNASYAHEGHCPRWHWKLREKFPPGSFDCHLQVQGALAGPDQIASAAASSTPAGGDGGDDDPHSAQRWKRILELSLGREKTKGAPEAARKKQRLEEEKLLQELEPTPPVPAKPPAAMAVMAVAEEVSAHSIVGSSRTKPGCTWH